MATILHISDLHRDQGSKLTNDSLLESLRLDMNRYVAEGISSPDAALVSGDIVYGVTSSDASNDALLKCQYDEAHAFLVRLADTFFDGDRERVVLVPGNHDVSHPHVLRATAVESLPDDTGKRALLAEQLTSEGTHWRWDWARFELRRVVDHDLYRRRMEPFADFYSTFYEGRRTFSLDPRLQFALHDFPELGIAVIGLSSCCENDLFNRSGGIHPDCVAGATRAGADIARRGRILIAMWHHNLAGGPRDSDYVDTEFLQMLMDGGIVVGLHGHQHRTQFLEHRFTADRKRAIAVISAGTLCGGPHSLPPGRMRAYNLVELDTAARSGKVHMRDMRNDSFSMPIWGAGYVSDFGGSNMAFELSAPLGAESPIHAAGEAVELLRKGNAREAIAVVRHYVQDPYARRVTVEALLSLNDWEGVRDFCTPPQSSSEIVAMCEALYELGDRGGLREFLNSTAVASSTDAAVRQSIEQARARLGGSP